MPRTDSTRQGALLFYPMMAYERIVNLSDALSGFRITMLAAVRKPERNHTGQSS
jgi:hypothetical protein